jgi:O-antigen ligase
MVGVLFTAVVALVYTAFHGGIDNAYFSSVALEDPIPQYRSYYPALMALGTAVGVASIKHDRWLSLATITACLVLLPITWSRAGILMVMVAFAATVFFCHLRGRRWWVFILAGGATAAGFAVIGKLAMTIGLWSQRVVTSDLVESDSERVHLAQESTKRIASSPLFGDAFQQHSDQLVGGGLATFDRLFPTHNQYLDYGVRGGFIAAFLFVAFLSLTTLVLLRQWWISSRQDFEPMYGAGLGLLAALIPAALTELYISQTWSGVVLMLFLGSLAHMVEQRRGGRDASTRRSWLPSLTRRR